MSQTPEGDSSSVKRDFLSQTWRVPTAGTSCAAVRLHKAAALPSRNEQIGQHIF